MRAVQTALPRTALAAFLLAAVAALVAAEPASAFRRPEVPQAVKLRRLDGWLGVGFEMSDEVRKRPGRVDTKETEQELFEEMKLDATASVYHPRFLMVDGSVLVRFEQEDRETSPASVNEGDIDEILNEYDLTLNFLPERPLNLLLYGSRSTSQLDSLDFPEFDVVNERLGATVRWRNQFAPMWLSAVQLEALGGGQNLTDEVTRTVTYRAEQNRERRRSSLQYDLDEKQNNYADTELTSQRARLANYLSFGKDARSTLNNSLQFLDQVGTIKRQELLGTSDVRLHHRDSFQTFYSYLGRISETDQEETLSHGVTAGLTHRLYRNLTTSANVGGTASEYDSGDLLEGNSTLALDYVRSIPFGSVTLGAQGGFRVRDESFTTEVGQVLDESHTFGVSDLIRLGSEFVQTSTIVVTDASGLTLYAEGIDYRVQLIGSVTEIVRLIGSTIPPGGTVLVDYDFLRSPDSRTHFIDRQFRAALNLFRSVQLYTSFRRSDRELVHGLDLGGEDDVADWVSGASFNRWGLHLGAEHREHESELIPYETDRLNAGLTLRLPFRGAFSGSASWARTDYPNLRFTSADTVTDDFTEVVTYQARLSFRPLRNLSFEGGGFMREEEGRVVSREEVFYGELHLFIRRLEVSIKAERRREKDRTGLNLDTIDQRDRDLVHVEVIRRF